MANHSIYLLAIESSCDDTAAAVSCNDRILANIVARQEIHAKYGGVVPELASRAHQSNIVPVVDTAIKESGISLQQLNGIAFTAGPGLAGSLMVGVSFAKSLSQGLNIPLLAVHHMKAHVLAHLIDDGSPIPPFPFLCLTVSGGHTEIVVVNGADDMKVIGQTLDDAAGEAFDKSAKMLGLPYPGGPLVDEFAKLGDASKFEFTIPKIPGLDYSFSGLKTQILYFLRDAQKQNPNFIENNMNDICASVQHVIVEFLMQKLRRAVKETGITHVALAGGVSANSALRTALKKHGEAHGWSTYIPAFEYCTDNAAMIAIAGYQQYLLGHFAELTISAQARMLRD